jgi:hypothetical protein
MTGFFVSPDLHLISHLLRATFLNTSHELNLLYYLAAYLFVNCVELYS